MAIIPPHYTATLVFTSPLLPLQTGEKTYSILLLLNCMTSSMPGTKSRGGNMHIEEELCAKFFYYVYLCKWHIRLFKKSLRCSSSCCPLVSLSARYMHTEWQQPKSLISFFFLQKLYKKGKWRFHCSFVTLLKVENERMMNFAKFHQHYLDFCANANELWVSPFKVNCTFPLISQQLFYPSLSYLLHLAY